MLTNILNILAITTTLGTKVAFNNKEKPIQNRSATTQAVNIEFTNGTTTESNISQEQSEIPTVKYHKSKEIYTYTNQQISVEAINITQETREYNINTGYGNVYYSNKLGERPRNKIEIEYNEENYNITTTQKIWFFKIQPVNVITNGSLNLKQMVDGVALSQRPREQYIDILYTQNASKIDKYLNQNNSFDVYTKNNSIYDKYREIMYDEAGYTSSADIQNNHINYFQVVVAGEELNYYETNIELQLRQNKINYLIIYEQEYFNNVEDQYTSSTMNYDTSADSIIWIQGTEHITTPATTEVIDIGGVMFDVLGMPFTFISVAFNLTLFPGTAYEINIAYLFLGIIAIIVFAFLVKLILSKLK